MRTDQANAILHVNNSLPSECEVCETGCMAGIMDCAADPLRISRICYSSAVVVLVVMVLLLSYLLLQFSLSFKKESTRLTLRKLIFGSSSIFALLRVIRYSSMLTKYAYTTLPIIFIDCLLFWVPYYFIVSSYSFLLVFWANICSTSRKTLSISWIGNSTRIKYILVFSNIVLFTLVVLIAVVNIYAQQYFAVVKIFFGVMCLVLSIAYLIEGYKVYRVISRTYGTKKEKSTKLLLIQKFSLVTLISSAVLIGAFVCIGISYTLPFFNTYVGCTVSQSIYRVFEITLILVITSPFKYDFEAGTSSSNDDFSQRKIVRITNLDKSSVSDLLYQNETELPKLEAEL